MSREDFVSTQTPEFDFSSIFSFYVLIYSEQNVNPAYSEIPHYMLTLERSGSMVECFTRDRGVRGSSLTSVTAWCP